jgi:hypothetical protein
MTAIRGKIEGAKFPLSLILFFSAIFPKWAKNNHPERFCIDSAAPAFDTVE